MLGVPTLRYFNYELPTMLETDALDGVAARVLSQQDLLMGL
jgi:hypothetical protein